LNHIFIAGKENRNQFMRNAELAQIRLAAPAATKVIAAALSKIALGV